MNGLKSPSYIHNYFALQFLNYKKPVAIKIPFAVIKLKTVHFHINAILWNRSGSFAFEWISDTQQHYKKQDQEKNLRISDNIHSPIRVGRLFLKCTVLFPIFSLYVKCKDVLHTSNCSGSLAFKLSVRLWIHTLHIDGCQTVSDFSSPRYAK